MAKITGDLVAEGRRMYGRHLRVRGKHFTRFHGSSTEICHQILDRVFVDGHYNAGLGNHANFYSRDFGMCLQSLLDLGKRKEAIQSLRYALDKYEKFDGIKTFVNRKGKPVNFPTVYSPDSVALLLRSVAIVDDKSLTDRYRFFLQRELNKFYSVAINKISGEVKRHIHFGGMRDHAQRDSSAYDTVMAAVISREADALKLENPLQHTDYKEMLLEHYWMGNYFRDDRSSKLLTADANIYPFWYGVVDDMDKQERAILSMQHLELDKPFPVKYVASKRQKGKTIGTERFVKNWQADSVWPMSGLPFIDLVGDVDEQKAREYLLQYKELIERHGTFLEVYKRDGSPFRSKFYSSDEGMVWCAMYLTLAKRFKIK